ncbi:hypothetical protein, partial [Acidipila rosea]
METQIVNATEFRNVSLSVLNESKTNPRRTFEPTALKELADYVPGHIIGIMFRWSLCGRCGGKPHGLGWRAFWRAHNGHSE